MEKRNPIGREIAPSGFAPKPPALTLGYQFVVIPKRGQPYAVVLGQPLRGADFRSSRSVVEVNIRQDHLIIQESKIPSRNDAFTFQLSGYITYKVIKPEMIVQRHVDDTREDVCRIILPSVYSVCSRYSIEHVQDAQSEVSTITRVSADTLLEAGYELQAIHIRVQREESLIEFERGGRFKSHEVDVIEQFMTGPQSRRDAYFMANSPEERALIFERQERERAELRAIEMQTVARLIEMEFAHMKPHERGALLKEAQKKLSDGYSASSIISSFRDQPVALPSSTNTSSQSEKDDWDDPDTE